MVPAFSTNLPYIITHLRSIVVIILFRPDLYLLPLLVTGFCVLQLDLVTSAMPYQISLLKTTQARGQHIV